MLPIFASFIQQGPDPIKQDSSVLYAKLNFDQSENLNSVT